DDEQLPLPENEYRLRMNVTSLSVVTGSVQPRHDWTRDEAQALYDLPFADLMFQAQSIHRSNFDPNHVETASLLSIKTGGCPEDCGYCSQSAHYKTDVKASKSEGAGRGGPPRPPRKSRGREPLLHGGRVAQSEGQGSRSRLRHGQCC